MPMGRRRTKDFDLPPHMRRKGKYFYFDHGGSPRKYTPLGCSRPEAMAKWAALYAAETGTEVPQAQALFSYSAARYRREVLPTKARKTQLEQDKELTRLIAVFGEMAVEEITPEDVRDYLDIRGTDSMVDGKLVKGAPVAANREKALLSHVINKARAWGHSKKPNPCAGVEGFREFARDKLVEDDELAAVRKHADQALRDALDLAYLTGQRPADVLKLRRSDIKDGYLTVVQNKSLNYRTPVKLRIAIEGELQAVIARITGRPVPSLYLVADVDGKPLRSDALRYRFEKAREAAGMSFQFRDMRAKAATEADRLEDAQALLGHTKASTTDRYIRARAGRIVRPLNRKVGE